MSTTHGYPLIRDNAEHTRLSQQAEFWAADAAALFDAAGIAAGQHVADIGCGTPEVAEMLAQRVGPRGSVRALDSDAPLVQAMSRRQMAWPWLGFECGDAFDTGWPGGSLDAVHARFLAAPAGRCDELLAEMLRLLRPGGRLMLQEPVADSWSLPAAGPAWPRLVSLIRTGFRSRGGDFDAGRDLAARLRQAGARRVRSRSVVHQLPSDHPYARLPLAFCDSLAALWRSGLLADKHEIAALRAQVAAALDERPGMVSTFTLVQVWGER